LHKLLAKNFFVQLEPEVQVLAPPSKSFSLQLQASELLGLWLHSPGFDTVVG